MPDKLPVSADEEWLSSNMETLETQLEAVEQRFVVLLFYQ